MCLADGVVAPATIADHIVPQHGDVRAFWLGALQSLCDAHHKSTKAQLERKGYVEEIRADGWPVDPLHPANMLSAGGGSPEFLLPRSGRFRA